MIDNRSVGEPLIRCLKCTKQLDPRRELARVELDPSSNGPGYHVGYVCDDCGEIWADRFKASVD